MQRIASVDVGLKGAFCIMTIEDNGSKEIVFQPMPLIGSDLDFHALTKIFGVLIDAHVFVEKVTAFKMGVAGAFKFGRQAGAIEAMLHAFRLEHSYVTPRGWQKMMHEGVDKKSMPDPKQRSLAAVRRLFPDMNLLRSEKCKFPDSGYIDSLLIAEYGRRTLATK